MTESKEKIITVRIPENFHQIAKVRLAELGTSFQQVLQDLFSQWLEAGMARPPARDRQAGTKISKSDALLIASFLDFWHNPHDAVDIKLRKLLEDVLEVREKHAKDSRKSTA